ncbi:MAG: AAA family ATPase [Bacteroidota bacterium]
MKFKKVEISAFRAYNDVADSTFDFTLPNAEVADFVSIYAPNGYGKTSFYDAVEWCITGQIERFHRSYTEYSKLGKENRKANKENPFFLQHNNQKDLLGSVNITTTTKPFSRGLTSSTVYDFNKKASEIYFKDVILSQDLIDSFIKEDKAEDRYNKFIESISYLKDYNNALKNIVKLAEAIAEELKIIEKNKKETEENQLSLDFEGDEKILLEINNAISNLIELEESIQQIEKEKFSKKEYDALTQKVNSKITRLQIDIDSLKSFIDIIDSTFNGTDSHENNIGVTQYFNELKRKERLTVLRKELNDTIQLIKDLKKQEKQFNDLSAELDEKIKTDKEILKIKKRFSEFLKTENDIKKVTGEIDSQNSDLKKNSDLFEKLVLEENNLNVDLNQLREDLKIKQEKFKELPDKIKTVLEIDQKKKSTNENINKIKKQIEKDSKELEAIISELNEYIYYKSKVHEDIEILLDYTFFEKLRKEINKILELKSEIKKTSESISKLEMRISNQEILNNELNEFISKGLELTTKNESSSCILCGAEYTSYKELADRISNNKLLDNILKDSIKEKNKLELDKKRKTSKVNEEIKSIEAFIQKSIDNLKLRINRKSTEIKDNQNNLKEKENSLVKLKDEELTLKDFFEDVAVDSYEEKLEKDIKSLQKIEKEKSTSLNEIEKQKKDIAIQNEKLNNKISILKKKVEENKKKKRYTEVVEFFNVTLKTNEVDESILDNEISENKKQVSDLKNKIDDYQKEIKEKRRLLAKNELSEQELDEKIKTTENEELTTDKLLENYEQLTLTELKIDLKNLSVTDTKKSFEELKTVQKNILRNKEDALKNYKIVERLKDNSYQFLESEKTKKQITDFQKKIDTYSKIVEKLNKEKENLETFLKTAIDGFFHTKLISAIYQKIDPHPDYNQIKFNCDFTERSPRLQIYTIDKKGNESIPALYFSSAQINVLSLSIFLARALKAKKPNGDIVECIFIDDPIQSMDSINILSFIDLFRSIVVNLKRQLIVSSHEENFHLLLQKKIPSGLFKSKFISFDSFGKVRVEENDKLMLKGDSSKLSNKGGQKDMSSS